MPYYHLLPPCHAHCCRSIRLSLHCHSCHTSCALPCTYAVPYHLCHSVILPFSSYYCHMHIHYYCSCDETYIHSLCKRQPPIIHSVLIHHSSALPGRAASSSSIHCYTTHLSSFMPAYHISCIHNLPYYNWHHQCSPHRAPECMPAALPVCCSHAGAAPHWSCAGVNISSSHTPAKRAWMHSSSFHTYIQSFVVPPFTP
jgi:hypothetical protein